MYAVPRPLVAATVAVVGASAIAISPVGPAGPAALDIHAAPAIQLAASTDLADIFTRAGQNTQALFDTWRQAPAPILQQIVANQIAYLKELPDFAAVADQIQTHLRAALAAPTAPDLSTLDSTHRAFYQLLPAVLQLPGVPDLLQLSISPTGKQLLAFSTTALSGVVLGMAGPVLGPLIVLSSSVDAIRAELTSPTPDVAAALNTLTNIPAAMTDAFLNGGQHVDLTALATTFGPAIGVSFPAGVKVGIALGGLLSPGGSIFNALDFAYDNDLLGVLHIHVPLATGSPVGPIGAFMEFTRAIAKSIGWTAPATAAATARSAAAPSGLAAANEVPRSVLASVPTAAATTTIAPKATTKREAKASKGSSVAARGHTTAKRTPAAAGSGKGSSARAKAPAKAAAG
ncbi:outer membrane porin GjpA [Mycobacterium sp. ENV421]|uniref:outer membrane porin GjpA n=1 Tax=Mycobacterium sp. ENV421 TaxID=1213407 RepID=UPI00115B475E|nr:outer membrane porin GjpA [Mycobacterium sp. ENV421]